jgi:hypothetical protein
MRRYLIRRALAGAMLAAALACGAQAQSPPDNRHLPDLAFKDALDQRLDAFLAMAEGEYLGEWPGAFAKRLDVDLLPSWSVFKQVDAPAFGKTVAFWEVREGGPEGRILRQRVIVFDTAPDRTHNFATFYPILDFAPYARADLHPEKLAHLSPANLPFFGRGCQMNLIGDTHGDFRLLTAATSCVIPYPDGMSRYSAMELDIQPTSYSFQEAAFNLDGVMTGGNPKTVWFIRQAPK